MSFQQSIIMFRISTTFIELSSKFFFRYFRHLFDFRFIFFDFLQLFVDYTNVDWINDKNIRYFIFDYIFNFENVVINWFLKRQIIIALSICEIEYMNQCYDFYLSTFDIIHVISHVLSSIIDLQTSIIRNFVFFFHFKVLNLKFLVIKFWFHNHY